MRGVRLVFLCTFTTLATSGVGCGDDTGTGGSAPELHPRFESGERLRAKVLDAGDGAVVFQEWYDSELETACTFTIAADGATRCLPSAASEVVYGDAACTELVTFRYSECQGAAPAYGIASEFGPVDECGFSELLGTTVYEIGEPLGLGTIYRKAADGSCMLDNTMFERFAAGPILEASVFVAETEVVTEDRGDGLGRRVRLADDGSVATVDLLDLANDTRCNPIDITTATGAVRTCVGNNGTAIEGTSTTALFSDAACTAPVPYVPTCTTPTIMARFFLEECQPPEITLHEVGTKIESLYYVVEEACIPDDLARISYELGSEIDPATLANVETVELGGGRVRVRADGDEAGRAISLQGTFFDSNTGQTCNAIPFEGDSNGISRCLPSSMGYIDQSLTTFADAECTEGLYIHEAGACGVEAPSLAYRSRSEACTTSYEAVVELSSFDGATIFLKGAAGGCTAVPFENVVGPTAVALRVGGEVPLEDFAAITTRIE